MSNISMNLMRSSSLFSKALTSATRVTTANYHEKVIHQNKENLLDLNLFVYFV